jgi:hypothetical protein
MRPGKSGKSDRKPASSSAEKKSPKQNPPSDVPTWPRLDLAPPVHMLRGLRGWGSVVLASGYLGEEDRAVVKQAMQQLSSAEPELFALLGRMRDPASARKLLELIAAITAAAYVVGAHGGMTNTARVFFEKSRATHMRVCRATSNEEQELRAAIKAELDAIGGASEHAYKDAEAIRDRVNARLSGRRAVSVDAIARRLARAL